MKSLRGHFLIASPTLQDPNFARAVILMLQHGDGGALGVVINRPLEVSVKTACEQVLGMDVDIDGPLHQGGPCEAVLMALHDDPADEAVLPGLSFTTDKDDVERLLNNPPPHMKFIVGYSGWGQGQLESELESGSWLIVPASAERVYAGSPRLWSRLVAEANLSKYVDPKRIPEDPSVN